jgi:hypothetical protein
VGQKRRATERLACGECGADGFAPCINKRTGKVIKGFHSSRRVAGKHDHLNAEVARIEGEADDFWRFCWEAIGLPANKYPPPGKPYWHFMPELDPSRDAYFGDW